MVELDLAFEPEEVMTGLERLFTARGLQWCRRDAGARCAEFTIAGLGGGDARVSVAPLPPERRSYPTFFPRTLLQLELEHQGVLNAMHRDIILAFMRVMG